MCEKRSALVLFGISYLEHYAHRYGKTTSIDYRRSLKNYEEKLLGFLKSSGTFSAPEAGKSVWYRFRYINTRGEAGPWSMVYTSTVTK